MNNEAHVSFETNDQRIDSAAPPAIPGLAFRAYRGAADVPAMLVVRQRAAAWDGVDPHSPRESLPTLQGLTRAYADAPASDPNILIVEVAGQLIGYNRVVGWTEEGDLAVYLHLGWLLPEWRGMGIGTAMLRRAEGRPRALAAARGARGPAVYATNASSTECEATALVLAEGYHVDHNLSDMALRDAGPMLETPLSDGVDLRPAAPRHYPDVYHAWKAIWMGLWGTTPEGEEDYRAFLGQYVDIPDFEPALWQIAWADDAVVGLVLCQVSEGVGVVGEVGVRREWRRRGLARALLVRGLNALLARGVTEARILTRADDQQGARTLYERVGFREVKQHRLYRKPMGRHVAASEQGI